MIYDPDYHICLSDGVNFWLGPVRNIVSLEQDQNYCKITLSNGQKLRVRKTLSRLEEKLPSSLFFRTGRDCIVNLSYVKQMQAYDSKRYSFIMSIGSDNEIVLSRQQSIFFRKSKSLAYESEGLSRLETLA